MKSAEFLQYIQQTDEPHEITAEMEALRLMTGTPTRNYEEIDRLLSCPICLEVFTKPVVILPCQHNLCRKCANDVFQQRGTPMGSGGRFRCPTCRYEVMLDRHGVYGLQRNLLVENIIDMYQQEGRKPSFMKVEQTLMCEDHEEEKVNIYCLTCQKPTCSLCKVFGQHQDCEVAPMDKVYKEQKKEISDAIALLVTGNDRLQSIIGKTEDLGKLAESNGRKVKSDLCEAFDKLYAVLEERKTSMMSKITADVEERSQVLKEMLKNYGQQLEGASKLMEASLSLLEERSIPQFLASSRDMIEKVIKTSRSSEVRKPPFNIQNMDEFHVNFNGHESLLYQLDFSPLADEPEPSSSRQDGETENVCEDSDVEEEYEANVENDANDSDDGTTTSIASRSDVGSQIAHQVPLETSQKRSSNAFLKAKRPFKSTYLSSPLSNINYQLLSKQGALHTDTSGPSYPFDHVTSRQNDESSCPVSGSTETKKANTDDKPVEVKKGRWYDKFVRELPSPISMNTFPSPMESSVHMKVIIPPSNDEDDDLKKDTEDQENVSSIDSEERDREIEELLAPARRRTWVSRLPILSSPDGSNETSPRSSPTYLRRYNYTLGNNTPTLLSPRTSPVMFQRRTRFRDFSPTNTSLSSPRSSPLSRRKLRSMQSSSPSGMRHRHNRSESPTNTSSRSNLRRPSDTSSVRRDSSTPPVPQVSSNGTQSESPSSQTSRRPSRVYCTHKRRTWSHLLDKK